MQGSSNFMPMRHAAAAICSLLFAGACGAQGATKPPIPTERISGIKGLKAAAEIRIDPWGVPHIYARSEADLFFVQGFNSARDRLFQIDLWRRRGLGQLAEVFGEACVEQDRAARLFLYRGDMDAEWRKHESERLAMLYSQGRYPDIFDYYVNNNYSEDSLKQLVDHLAPAWLDMEIMT